MRRRALERTLVVLSATFLGVAGGGSWLVGLAHARGVQVDVGTYRFVAMPVARIEATPTVIAETPPPPRVEAPATETSEEPSLLPQRIEMEIARATCGELHAATCLRVRFHNDGKTPIVVARPGVPAVEYDWRIHDERERPVGERFAITNCFGEPAVRRDDFLTIAPGRSGEFETHAFFSLSPGFHTLEVSYRVRPPTTDRSWRTVSRGFWEPGVAELQRRLARVNLVAKPVRILVVK